MPFHDDIRNRDLRLHNPFKGDEPSIRSNLASRSIAGRSPDLIAEWSNSLELDLNRSASSRTGSLDPTPFLFVLFVALLFLRFAPARRADSSRFSANIESAEEQVRLLSPDYLTYRSRSSYVYPEVYQSITARCFSILEPRKINLSSDAIIARKLTEIG